MTADDPGVFAPDQLDALCSYFDVHGYAALRGLLDEAGTAAMEAECVEAQAALVAGQLDERYGTTILIEGDAGEKASAFANYVTHVQELSPAVFGTATHPVVIDLMHRWIGKDAWLMDDARFGVVYQDARPGRESSYTRIGWHSDWQSGPNLDMWPSVAFTIHIDATSPANGFLRVVPGSQMWATPAPYRNANDAVVPESCSTTPTSGTRRHGPPMTTPTGATSGAAGSPARGRSTDPTSSSS